ncbi:hypothetical protein [Enhygromyxa salina]|uniref:hypothetical protein n=1 Tax=Enhygromyxa salina TaxID=215803 RepID=UPI0011B2019D|nr:hypothetical protein [Enhygromyxa salina]
MPGHDPRAQAVGQVEQVQDLVEDLIDRHEHVRIQHPSAVIGDLSVAGAPELAVELERADVLTRARDPGLGRELGLAAQAFGDQDLDERGDVGEHGAARGVLAQRPTVAREAGEGLGRVAIADGDRWQRVGRTGREQGCAQRGRRNPSYSEPPPDEHAKIVDPNVRIEAVGVLKK